MDDELDHNVDVVGNQVRSDFEAVAVDQRGVPCYSGSDRQLIHDPRWHARGSVLGALRGLREFEGRSVEAKRKPDSAFECRARRQTGTGGNIGNEVSAQAGWCAEFASHGGHVGAPVRGLVGG